MPNSDSTDEPRDHGANPPAATSSEPPALEPHGDPLGHGLSHLDPKGQAHMVDVGDKDVTDRRAVAAGFVRCSDTLIAAIREHGLSKGDLPGTARLAGILAAKRVDELIPLCHTLPLDQVGVEIAVEDQGIRITATARTRARTGVEMEALTAVSVAALTVIDMGKALDPGMIIEGVRVIEKTGGRRGPYRAPPLPDDPGHAESG